MCSLPLPPHLSRPNSTLPPSVSPRSSPLLPPSPPLSLYTGVIKSSVLLAAQYLKRARERDRSADLCALREAKTANHQHDNNHSREYCYLPRCRVDQSSPLSRAADSQSGALISGTSLFVFLPLLPSTGRNKRGRERATQRERGSSSGSERTGGSGVMSGGRRRTGGDNGRM